MVALLTFIFLSGATGAPPPSERALAISALGLWMFVPWGWWVDRHREPAVRPEPVVRPTSRPLAAR